MTQGTLFLQKPIESIGSQPVEQLPTPWVKYAKDTSLSFEAFKSDIDAISYESGEVADDSDIESRWRCILFWRKKLYVGI